MSRSRSCLKWVAAVAIGAVAAGCDQPTSAPPSTQSESRPTTPPLATDNVKQRQADSLNRIRAADPHHQTIDRALLNDQNELGLILDRTAELARVPAVLRSILTQLARESPGEALP